MLFRSSSSSRVGERAEASERVKYARGSRKGLRPLFVGVRRLTINTCARRTRRTGTSAAHHLAQLATQVFTAPLALLRRAFRRWYVTLCNLRGRLVTPLLGVKGVSYARLVCVPFICY